MLEVAHAGPSAPPTEFKAKPPAPPTRGVTVLRFAKASEPPPNPNRPSPSTRK